MDKQIINNVKDAYSFLINSSLFVDFCESEKNYYFVHAFRTRAANDDSGWEFGFYSKKKDKIVVFEINPLKRREPEDVFKAEKTIIPLDLDVVKIDFLDASISAKSLLDDIYSAELIIKEIVLLQNTDSEVWNFTFITKAFNVINVKINAVSGSVVNHKKYGLFDLGKPDI